MVDKKKGLQWIKKAGARFLMSLGAMFLIFLLMLSISLGQFVRPSAPELPEKIVLRYVLEEGIAETKESSFSAFDMPFSSNKLAIQDMIRAINTAANDNRVEGLVLRIKDGAYGLAHVQSLRRSIKAFREAGKFAFVYATSYGGMTPATASYYLSSSFDEIWLQPVGVVGINGFAYETPFFKQLMDKIGMQPEIIQIGQYKSSAESLMRQSMSKAHREMMNDILNDYYEQFVADVSSDRDIDPDTLKKLMDQSPINHKKAKDNNLVTHVGYIDQFIDAVNERSGKDAIWVDLPRYNKAVSFVQKKFKNRIAVIHVDGPIINTTAEAPSLLGDMTYELSDIMGALNAASLDKSIQAIVLRVNSPGGTPEASETLRRGVTQALEHKPVVVSMGNMAASGGYWAVVNGTRIYAEPMTLTGSIGVFGGKLSAAKLMDKVGINVDTVKKGEHANMWSITRPFSQEERKTVISLMEETYETFLKRVSNGRGIDIETVESLAQGRVYTGLQAREVGLVDSIGGLDDAAVSALVLAGGDPKDGLALLTYPKPRSTLERFFLFLNRGFSAKGIINYVATEIAAVTKSTGMGLYAVEPHLDGFQAH